MSAAARLEAVVSELTSTKITARAKELRFSHAEEQRPGYRPSAPSAPAFSMAQSMSLKASGVPRPTSGPGPAAYAHAAEGAIATRSRMPTFSMGRRLTRREESVPGPGSYDMSRY